MFDSHLWSHHGLPLREIIEVAGLFLKFAQSINNSNALLLLCGNVGAVLSAFRTHLVWTHSSRSYCGVFTKRASDCLSCDVKTLPLRNVLFSTSELVLTGHTPEMRSVAYSPSGHQLALGSLDETVRLWDAHTGIPGPILTGHTGGVRSVAYSSSGHQLTSGSSDKIVRLWDAETGAPMSVLSGHSDIVFMVTFSSSGHMIASCSKDETVRIWDAESHTRYSIVNGHTAQVWTVAYSSDGHRIASCSDDGTVRLWDVLTGDCLVSLNDVDNCVTGLAWRENDSGSYLAVGNDDNTVRMWRVTEEEGKPHVELQWSSQHTSLKVKDANIQNAHGLTRMQIKLLKQRGNVGEPIPPMSIRTVGEKLVGMAATVNRLTKEPRKEGFDDRREEPLAGEPEPEFCWKRADLAVEE